MIKKKVKKVRLVSNRNKILTASRRESYHTISRNLLKEIDMIINVNLKGTDIMAIRK